MQRVRRVLLAALLSALLPALLPACGHGAGTDSPTQLCIELPDNYTPERKFPLFVFHYGGHGGPGAGAGRGQEIMQNRDCIFVNLPLFKERIDPDGPCKGMMITPEQDGAAICSAYGAMLRKIYETVPNIDTSRNIIGGMSNGIEVTGLEMNDTGHDMPPRFNIEVERWVKKQLGR